MQKISWIIASLLLVLLASCAPTKLEPTSIPTDIPTAIPTPRPLTAKDYVLQAEMLGDGCTVDGEGSENSNERVLELREDGDAYIKASGRIEG
jgi:hypothetical protein